MSYTPVGSCPVCGAPIYAPTVWHGITPPPSQYSCGCRFGRMEYYAYTSKGAGDPIPYDLNKHAEADKKPSVKETCEENNVQNCMECDDYECCDNTNPNNPTLLFDRLQADLLRNFPFDYIRDVLGAIEKMVS